MKFLVGWKLCAIASAFAAAISFYAGQRWEKGSLTTQYKAQITANAQTYEKNLQLQNFRWGAEVAKLKLNLLAWEDQAYKDTQTINNLVKMQDQLRSQFDALDTEITVVSYFGVCNFSDDAVSLLHTASETAAVARVSFD